MKNKASIIVLLVEIIAIVAFHSAKATGSSTGEQATVKPAQDPNFSVTDQKPRIFLTSLR